MSRLRISAISYLNTAPLMWDFEHGSAGADFDLSYTIPSACAAELSAGTADIGIIPSAAYASIPDRSEEHTSEVQSLAYLVCRLLLEKKKNPRIPHTRCH